MIQIQYRIPKGYKPTPLEIQRWRDAFIAGKKVPGVRIQAIDWRYGGSQTDIRQRLRKPWRSSVAGIVARYADPSITMCDYDRVNEKPMRRVWAVSRMLTIKPLWVEFRRTKKGWHMTIQWNQRFAPAETIAIQSILGSDAFRETYNLARVRGGVDGGNRWNLLFQEKIR